MQSLSRICIAKTKSGSRCRLKANRGKVCHIHDKNIHYNGGNILTEAYHRIKGFISGPREGRPPQLREFLKNHGNEEIRHVKICRIPIFSIIEKLGNILSLGKLERNKRGLNYDRLMHLYCYLQSSTGKVYRMDKDEVVKIIPSGKAASSSTFGDNRGQCVQIPNFYGITFNQYFENAEKKFGMKQIYVYKVDTANCQIFQKQMLEASNKLSSSLNHFIMQDVPEVLKGLGYLTRTANAVTNLAGRADIIRQGNGIKVRAEALNKKVQHKVYRRYNM